MRVRVSEESNYRSIFDNGFTLRMAIDINKPVKPLKHPEILDWAIGTKCHGGCPYCYVSALPTGTNFENVVDKIQDYYGNMELNDRPYQIAIGGHSEPTLHPDFCEILKVTSELGIMPNYTTNGMHINQKILDYTRQYSGGVAVSCHPHLEKCWKKAVQLYVDNGIRTCLHIIVGEPNTNDKFWEIYDTQKGIEKFVALPYQAAGRATPIDTQIEWGKFFQEVERRQCNNIAFGALFYEYLQENPIIQKKCQISMYPPEMFSSFSL